MNAYSHHRENAGRNFLGALVVASIAVVTAKIVAPAMGPTGVRTLLMAAWPLFAVLAGAVLALVYRLVSDTAGVGKFTRAQRYELEKIVRKKTWKLWFLFALILLPLGLAIGIQYLAFGQMLASKIAIGVSIAGLIFFCAYVPSTWLDLRSYVAQMDLQKNQDEAARDVVSRLKR